MQVNEEEQTAQYLFHQGTNYTAYTYFGVHKLQSKADGTVRYVFRVWAPNADAVAVTGDFCAWEYGVPLTRITDGGIWEGAVESRDTLVNTFYKYRITRGNRSFLKADPYARQSQTLGETASVITEDPAYEWHDAVWLKQRAARFRLGKRNRTGHFCPSPIHIYEVHLASWQTRGGQSTENGKNYLSYREIADLLVPYVLQMGYTHVEFMPIMEYPFDGSWGYQISGYYAPTTRFGNHTDFMYLIDKLHTAGVGVILDWVPAHFPKDAHGLYEFDGKPLYEYQGWDRMEHRGWGTRFFDVGRNEVQCFLISNALFWLREYHIDGLRVDAVASMLYLDYDRAPGEWIPNRDGSNKNEEAIAFFRKLNTEVFAEFPDVLMIAEESTDWPMITKPVYEGGLGFSFKWNMGWASDSFSYFSMDPIYRKYHHDLLTFPLMYAFSENYILPISHDEVVHGKRSLIGKLFGSYEEQFAALRLFFLYMMTIPGKKLTFMGSEFAQFREWNYQAGLEWFLLAYPMHAQLQRYSAALNHIYLNCTALWRIDDGWDGFCWIDPDNTDEGILSYRRMDGKGGEVFVLLNCLPVERKEVLLEVTKRGTYTELFSTAYNENEQKRILEKDLATHTRVTDDGRHVNMLTLPVPPYGGVILQRNNQRKSR